MLVSSLLALALFDHADAADRVRRIALTTTSTVQPVVRTEASAPPSAQSVTLTAEGLETGTTATLNLAAKSTRRVIEAQGVLASDVGQPTTVTATIRVRYHDLTTAIVIDSDVCTAACPFTEAVAEDGTLVRVRPLVGEATADFNISLEAQIVPPSMRADFTTGYWVGDASVSLAWDGDGDGELDQTEDLTVTDDSFRTRWVGKKGFAPTDDAWQLDAAFKTASGVTTATDFAVVNLDGATGLLEGGVRDRAAGGQKLVLWTWSEADAPVGSVAAGIGDADTQSALAEVESAEAADSTAILAAELAALKDGQKAEVTVSAYAGDKLLGTEALVVTVQDGVATDAVRADGGAPKLVHRVVVDHGAKGSTLSFSLAGAEAELATQAKVVVAVNGTKQEASAPLEGTFQRWVMPFDGGEGVETYEIDAEVRGEDGIDLDGWVFEAQAGFGTGTRSTASQANNKAELL